MIADTLSIADRLERSGVPSPHARAIAAEFGGADEARRREFDALRGGIVTREYLDLALAKLRAEVERDIAQLRVDTERLRADMERLLREQTNRLVVWLGAIVGVAVTLVGGLGVLL